jgi:hypothetical protein
MLDDRFQLFAYADIPVDVQKERNREGDSGENEDENRMNEPFCLFHSFLHLLTAVFSVIRPFSNCSSLYCKSIVKRQLMPFHPPRSHLSCPQAANNVRIERR